MKSLAVRFLGARYRYIYPQHLNYFTRQTLSGLVEARFSVVDFRSTHFNPIVIWQDWRWAAKTFQTPSAPPCSSAPRPTSRTLCCGQSKVSTASSKRCSAAHASATTWQSC